MKSRLPFIHLSPSTSNALLEAAAAMEAGALGDGPERHRRLQALFETLVGVPEHTTKGLSDTLRARPPVGKIPSFKTAQKAETLVYTWSTMGMEVVACRFPSGHPLKGCPKFLFSLGTAPDASSIFTAAFNSRKGKPTRRADPWVVALRRVFARTADEPVAWVSSFGTAIYDLVTCWAHLQKKPVMLIAPPSLNRPSWDCFRSAFHDTTPCWFLSCLPERAACSPKKSVLCRDRLVAAAAEHLYAIEIRGRGNLVRVLCDELSARPRPIWVFPSRAGAPETEGNAVISETFPRNARIWPDEPGSYGRSCPKAPRRSRPKPCAAPKMAPLREPFLFHYTRSCPGPWPGQTRCAWAEDLFRASPWADHTALDTLWRILTERRLRACGRLIRGQIPVVSWTGVPPRDLTRLIRWNPALIRWTFEPYGVAVKRKVLKNLGARPAIYAREADYLKIRERDRFRFQLDEPGRPSWKREREWRLAGDLDLDALQFDDWWAFVPTTEDVRWLEKHVPRRCRVIPLHPGSSEQLETRP